MNKYRPSLGAQYMQFTKTNKQITFANIFSDANIVANKTMSLIQLNCKKKLNFIYCPIVIICFLFGPGSYHDYIINVIGDFV